MVNSDHDKKYSSFNYITSVSFINGSEMMIAQCQMSNMSTIPPISTTISHLKSWNTKKYTTYCAGNTVPGLEQEKRC
jgi:hypothetical protein